MKKWLIAGSIFILIILIILYVQPPFVGKMLRGSCMDGGVSYFIDKSHENESWLTLGPVAFGKIQKCNANTYYLKKGETYEELSRWTFYREIAKQNKSCNNCLIQTRFESLS